MLFAFNVKNKFQLISVRFFKEFNVEDFQIKLAEQQIPSYTPFLKALLTKDEE